MKQEEKQLLLQDLCARLPYGVKITRKDFENPLILSGIWSNSYATFVVPRFFGAQDKTYNDIKIEEIKPYLRPMSSMTEEEKETYYNLCYEEEREELEFGEWAARIHYHDTIDSIDYLNSIHIDYRGLIEKGLAIGAPKGMYEIQN